MSFKSLGLNEQILKAIEEKGYTTPTPIQEKSIPLILEDRDVLGGAQTGTGKTAAFTLPLLQKMSASRGDKKASLQTLIMCPTRELAAQILASIEAYGAHLPLKSAAFFGGVKIGPQISQAKRGLDILVATPGRLLDHLSQGTISLKNVEYFVLDEADRMLDMGFIRDIKKVLKLLPKKRQNMLFSATFSKDIKNLSKDILSNPILIEVNPENSTADTVAQLVHPIEKTQKRHLLAHLIKDGNWFQVLVFARTKHGAHRLSKQLTRSGIPAASIHGDKTQGARTKALADFKSGKVQALVATDIAARGLDIPLLAHVVNFDLPNQAEDYIHRIGRTGRAGENGLAISLYCEEEKEKLRGIEKLLGRSIPKETVKDFTPVESNHQGPGRPSSHTPHKKDNERRRPPRRNTESRENQERQSQRPHGRTSQKREDQRTSGEKNNQRPRKSSTQRPQNNRTKMEESPKRNEKSNDRSERKSYPKNRDQNKKTSRGQDQLPTRRVELFESDSITDSIRNRHRKK